jgi:hypothetical protein
MPLANSINGPARIPGADKLIRDLTAMGTDRKTISEASKKAGDIVLNAALHKAKFKHGAGYKHVYPHQRGTGRLLKSLRVVSYGATVKIRGGGAKVPYANPIHWGWFYDKNNFIKKRITPNPFLAKALDYNREKILETYKTSLERLLKENGK